MSSLARRTAHERGVTLIEVLVSMLIMALGMVSLAALQGYTVRYQLGSAQRAQLAGLLSDYAERVRANLVQAPGAVAASAYLVSDNWTRQAGRDTPTSTKDCVTSVCSGSEVAQYDMAQWRRAVRHELPQGSVMVSGSASSGLTVTFMWRDKEYTSGTGASLLTRSATQCESATLTGSDQQTCCPSAAAAPEGVRCANFTVIP